MGNKAATALGDRPLEHPLNLSNVATVIALQSVPERPMGTMEVSGRVRQNDYNIGFFGTRIEIEFLRRHES
jgi:hypothetical protein